MSAYEDGNAVKGSSRKRKKRRKKRPFLTLFIIVLVLAGAFLLLKSSIFNVTSVEVEGNKYFTPSQVIELSGIRTGQNLIFGVKSGAARKKLLSSPYVSSARIEKIPPGRVKIILEERVEYAAVYTDAGYVIIDSDGTVLRISEEEPEITILEGIEAAEAVEGKPFKAQQSYLFTGTLKILEETAKKDLYFKKIFFSNAVVRCYVYDKYYCEGTPDGILENLSAIRELVEQHFKQDIDKGVIRVGSGGELFFDPKID